MGTIEAPDLLKDPRAKKLLAEPAAEDGEPDHLLHNSHVLKGVCSAPGRGGHVSRAPETHTTPPLHFPAVFDGHLDDVAEWREISQLVFKVGRDLEIFTDVTAQMMKKTANAVHRKGIGAGGVPEAKAAMQQMLTCFQDAVKVNIHDIAGHSPLLLRLLDDSAC